MTPFRIGTRGSRLALAQAAWVAERLRASAGARPVELVEIQTAGDRARDVPLLRLAGEGAFTKEIQRALLAGAVDAAVHSLKDLPTIPVEGLTLAAVPPRGPVEDVFVSLRHPRFDALPTGAIVATGSLRRQAQVLHRRPDLRVADMRGNVETRLRKLAEENLDALILARAGLERLGRSDAITEALGWMIPAVGQGALGVECRADDAGALALLQQLDDPAAHGAVAAERALLHALGGGCRAAIGAVAVPDGETLRLRAVVLQPDGGQRIDGCREGGLADAERLGRELAEELRARNVNNMEM